MSRCRTVNQTGPQPITMADVFGYCALVGLHDPEDRADLLFFITSLDIEYLKQTHERINQEREKAKRDAERKRGR